MHTETRYQVVADLPLYVKNTSESICNVYEQNQLQQAQGRFKKCIIVCENTKYKKFMHK